MLYYAGCSKTHAFRLGFLLTSAFRSAMKIWKYTSFLSVKNVKIVLRIWGKLKGIKVVEVNGPLN